MTERQTERQPERQPERQTERQTERHTRPKTLPPCFAEVKNYLTETNQFQVSAPTKMCKFCHLSL
jgi:hypothetical protein